MAYTEDALVEQPTISLCSDIGWETFDCYSETIGPEDLLGRENRTALVLTRKLQSVLVNRHVTCSQKEINLEIEKLSRDRSARSMTDGSGRQRVQYQCFDNFLLAVPPINLLESFSALARSAFREVFNLTNINLKEQRDLFLPRLVVGTIEF